MCTDCGFELSTDDMKKPIRYHGRAVIYPCRLCGKRFTKKLNMDVHKRIHGGKPNKCNLCGQTVGEEKEKDEDSVWGKY